MNYPEALPAVILNLPNKCLCCREINENKIVFHKSWSKQHDSQLLFSGNENSQH